MKKLRLHLYIILGLTVLGFVLGTLFDQQVSGAIFNRDDTFGILVSSVGTLPGYLAISFIGGGFLSLALKKQYKIGYTILFYVLCVLAFAASVFFAGREFFGVNGFNLPSIKWLGYLIVVPFASGVTYLGYYLISKSERQHIWIALAFSAIFIFLALVPGVTLLKSIFHRPRYRSLTLFDEINFHNWYQPCKNYKDLMTVTGLTSEEFKSFPSGHAGATLLLSLTAAFAPLLDKRIKKNHLVLFYSGAVITLLVCYARILVGAHFLSDVSMGALLTTVFTFLANEAIIFYKQKYENKKESQPVEAE